jgi:hypothetical protein
VAHAWDGCNAAYVAIGFTAVKSVITSVAIHMICNSMLQITYCEVNQISVADSFAGLDDRQFFEAGRKPVLS